MQEIEQFLHTCSAHGDFLLSVNGNRPTKVHCSIRFVFLEIKSDHYESIVYLPEYGPAINFGNSNSGNCIMYTPFDIDESQGFTLESNDQLLINLFFQLSMNALLSLNEFTRIVSFEHLGYSSYVVGIFPPNNDRPQFLKLSGTQLTFYEGESVFFQMNINSRTVFKTEFGTAPTFGFKSNAKDTIWIQTPNFKDTEKWFLLLVLVKQKEINNEKRLLSNIATTNKDGGKSPSIEIIVEADQKDEINNINNSDNIQAVTINEPAQKVEYNTKPENLEQKKYQIDKKEWNKKELKKQNKILIEELKRKKGQYLRSTQEIKIEQEPEPEYPQMRIDTSKKEIPKSQKNQDPISKKAFIRLINARLSYNQFRFAHFFKQPVIDFSIPILNIEHNPDDQNAILPSYLSSSPEEAFVLLSAIVVNQYHGKSIGTFYNVSEANNHNNSDAAYIIVERLGYEIITTIINSERTLSEYRLSALAHDKELLEAISQIHKPIKKPQKRIEILPFLFPHDPLKDLRHTIHGALYDGKQRRLDILETFRDFSRGALGFFLNHLRVPVDSLFSALATEIKDDAWSLFKEPADFRQSFALFLLHAMRADRLYGDLMKAFSQPAVIDRCFDACACARSQEAVGEFGQLVLAFANMRIQIANDGSVEFPLPGPQFESVFA